MAQSVQSVDIAATVHVSTFLKSIELLKVISFLEQVLSLVTLWLEFIFKC